MAKKTFRMADRKTFIEHVNNNDLDVVRQFINDGFPIDAPDAEKNVAVVEAAHKGHIDMVNLLIDSGAHLHVAGFMGYTALHRAARQENGPLVDLLLDRGANPRIGDEDGNTPAHLWMKHSSISRKLDGIPPVTFSQIERMLDAGLPINRCNNDGQTLLHLAIYSDQEVEVLRKLIARGADPMMTDKEGNRVLHNAALGPRESLQFLVQEVGLDINDPNRYGNTPLHIANFTKTVETILKLGGDPNIQNNAGITPFLKMVMSANDRQFEAEFSTYLDHGANLAVADFQGNTVESIAKDKKLIWVQKFLAARRANAAVQQVLKNPAPRP
jgi:ankyrin repeat protein